jgi:hypothetical protein
MEKMNKALANTIFEGPLKDRSNAPVGVSNAIKKRVALCRRPFLLI